MSDDIQLTNVRYRGDNEKDAQEYQNVAFNGSEADKDNANVAKFGLTAQQPMVELKHGHDNRGYSPNEQNGRDIDTSTDTKGDDDVIIVEDDFELEDLDEEPSNKCLLCIDKAQNAVYSGLKNNLNIIKYCVIAVLLVVYIIYFGFAMNHEFGSEPSVRLLWVTCVVVFLILCNIIWHFFGESITKCCEPCVAKMRPHETVISWVLVSALFIAVIIFVFVDVFINTKQPYNLVSGAGLLIYVLLFFIFSAHPSKVQWRAVAWGIGLQFLFAILILRWSGGRAAFNWLGDQISIFLNYSDVGASFIFGEEFTHHYFGFKVLPTIIFFSTAISILYYWGAMQVLVKWVAAVMQFAMGTTAGESMNAAGNIFVGQTEAPLMIKPLLPYMTKSELHAVMTGGFATIAGGVLAAYISFGVPANHLLSASVMSAPAALAMAKLAYPETKKSRTTSKDVKSLPKSEEVNFVAAASNGASLSIKLVANVAVNLIAFLSLLAFVNATLTWLGHRVGWENITFQLICRYVLYPFAFIMGVDTHQDCLAVAQLIGVKTFLNEFIAFADLGVIIKNRDLYDTHLAANGTYGWNGTDIDLYPDLNLNGTKLINGVISVRSEVIATYALCGFANVGSIGIQLGGLGAMAPMRKNDLASVAVSAMIAGNVACFMTACIAGLFYQGT